MALSALSLVNNLGVTGSKFASLLVGVSTGTIARVIAGNARIGSDGLIIDRLMQGVTNVTVREVALDGTGFRDTDLAVYGASMLDQTSTLISALAKGQTDAQQRAAIAAGTTTFSGLQSAGLGVVPPAGARLGIYGAVGTATIGTSPVFAPLINGGTAPYTLALATGTLPNGRALSGLTETGTYTTAGTFSYTLRATDSSTPTQTADLSVNVVVAAAITLKALTVSVSSATVGTAYSGTINGLTSGSQVALSGAGAAGLSVAGAVITGTPTTIGPVNLLETLQGATNSPNPSNGVLNVAASGTNALSGYSIVLTRSGQRSSAPLAALVA